MKRGKRKSKNDLLKQIISKNNLIKWIILGVLILVALFVIFKIVFTGHVTGTPSCADTDNKKDWTVKGMVSGMDSYGNSYNYTDNCGFNVYGDSFVNEGYCYAYPEGGLEVFQTSTPIYCQYGCSDGACINSDLTEWCTDSDNGRDYYVQGKTMSTYLVSKDTCLPTDTTHKKLGENFCNGTVLATEIITCPQTCSGGACVDVTLPYTEIILLSGNMPDSKSVNINGTQYLFTLNKTTSDTNGYIIVDEILMNIVEGMNYSFPGIIIHVEDITPPYYAGQQDRNIKLLIYPSNLLSCIESDAGTDYYNKGTTISFKNGAFNSGTDYCGYYNNPSVLGEYYCSFSAALTVAPFTCLGSCKDGACINASLSNTPPTTTPSEPTTTTPETPTPSEPTPTASPTESEITTPTTTEDDTLVCTSGCLFVKSCLPYGHRTALNYCNIDNTLIKQVSEGTCMNNFECTSNVCVEGQCTSPGLFLQFLNWFKALFGVQ